MGLGVFGPAPAVAHRGHDAITVVTLAADGSVTVSHRFEAHDLEPALPRIAADVQASLDDPQAIAALQAYLGQRFTIAVNGRPVALAHRSTQIDAAQVWVDYAGKGPRRARSVTIRANVMPTLYPRAAHQVQVTAPGVVHTITLAGGGVETISLTDD
ncbi:hypothetical protein GVO57_05680 [Sphingomonas changnyeongensis]|uniref:Uncharacterized protein n=1 Tax=Sphingomonas changnyeongensis TaxID=2698679 RepID=A0A7Z2S7K3_9SPHN|nr:DUF6702 family protein [Sphingomonas changnyeongensis]QHL90421.1 hypothetical protein GVO57_05680 [Sphingomonas changnyeongensis]